MQHIIIEQLRLCLGMKKEKEKKKKKIGGFSRRVERNLAKPTQSFD